MPIESIFKTTEEGLIWNMCPPKACNALKEMYKHKYDKI